MAIKAGWYDLPGYIGRYQINPDGRLRTVQGWAKGRELKVFFDDTSRIALTNARGERRTHTVARLVYETFIGHIPGYTKIAHINGDLWDNSVGNLKIITTHESAKHATSLKAHRVLKLNADGEIVDCFVRIKDAAEATFCSYSAVRQRCRGKVKDPFKTMDYNFIYERDAIYDDDGRVTRRKV